VGICCNADVSLRTTVEACSGVVLLGKACGVDAWALVSIIGVAGVWELLQLLFTGSFAGSTAWLVE
jgi:hypothetical protein